MAPYCKESKDGGRGVRHECGVRVPISTITTPSQKPSLSVEPFAQACSRQPTSCMKRGRTLEFEGDEAMPPISVPPQAAGPQQASYVFGFCEQFIASMPAHGMNIVQRLQRTFSSGMIAWSDFSGLGGSEIVLRMIEGTLLHPLPESRHSTVHPTLAPPRDRC